MKNFRELKKSIYDKLNASSDITGLVTNITTAYPDQTAVYPLITYELTGDDPYPYNESDEDGEISSTNFTITSFVKSSISNVSDELTEYIIEAFNGQSSLSNDYIICYSCYRTSMPKQMFDKSFGVYITQVPFRVVWASK